MSASVGRRERSRTETDPGVRPKIDVLNVLQAGGDVAYLVRVREDFDTRVTYHVKRLADFVKLDEEIRADQKDGMTVIKSLPDLPNTGSRFGVRRRLSGAGLSGFIEKQKAGLQVYCQQIGKQLPGLSGDSNVQAFFGADQPGPKDLEMHRKLMVETFKSPTVASMRGHWKIMGAVAHIWTVQPKGHVLLDGEAVGIEYYLHESGEGENRTIERGDGWVIDIGLSDDDTIIWHMPGDDVAADIRWEREADPAATKIIRRNSQAGAAAAQAIAAAVAATPGVGEDTGPEAAVPATPGVGEDTGPEAAVPAAPGVGEDTGPEAAVPDEPPQ